MTSPFPCPPPPPPHPSPPLTVVKVDGGRTITITKDEVEGENLFRPVVTSTHLLQRLSRLQRAALRSSLCSGGKRGSNGKCIIFRRRAEVLITLTTAPCRQTRRRRDRETEREIGGTERGRNNRTMKANPQQIKTVAVFILYLVKKKNTFFIFWSLLFIYHVFEISCVNF